MNTTEKTDSSMPPLNVTRILVPTDFSECADEALNFATQLAVHYQADIRLLHVLTTFDPELDPEYGWRPYATQLRQELQDGAQQRMTAVIHAHSERGIRIEPVLRNSFAVADTILEEAIADKADLIILGTHGRRGLKRMLMGSVAAEVVRRAPVSVLTVRATEGQIHGIRRILAPTDLSEHAARSVETAKDLAKRYGAALDVLHVVEPIPFPASISIGSRSFYDYLPELRSHLMKELEDLAGGEDFPVETRLEHGHAAHTISSFAIDHGSDLIVMATHGLSAISRFFIGSVTEQVVQTAPCPVLTVRTMAPPEEQKAVSHAEEQQEVS